jgi:hypothetical protein
LSAQWPGVRYQHPEEKIFVTEKGHEKNIKRSDVAFDKRLNSLIEF